MSYVGRIFFFLVNKNTPIAMSLGFSIFNKPGTVVAEGQERQTEEVSSQTHSRSECPPPNRRVFHGLTLSV